MDNIRVISSEPQVDLFLTLKELHYEIRCKRDAISLIHQQLNSENNTYNKVIICMSLILSFIESLKMKLELTEKEKWGYTISNTSSIIPIAISTIIAVISSLIKFKRYNEHMETLSSSLIKLNNTLLKIRKLETDLNFIPLDEAKKIYTDVILTELRDSLIDIESSVYPNIRQKWFVKAQQNILRQVKSDTKYQDKIKKHLGLTPDIDQESQLTDIIPETPNNKTETF